MRAIVNNTALHEGAVQINTSLREILVPTEEEDHSEEAKEIIEHLSKKLESLAKGSKGGTE